MEDTEDYILLDVRTEEEFQELRIDGAILIPDDQIGAKVQKQLPDKDTTILVYCRSGRRSANAAKELVQMGYAGIYDFGGIIDWPYDTVSGEEKEE
jgi:phage shock protein E